MGEKSESESYEIEEIVKKTEKVRETQEKDEDWEEFCESERKILSLKR